MRLYVSYLLFSGQAAFTVGSFLTEGLSVFPRNLLPISTVIHADASLLHAFVRRLGAVAVALQRRQTIVGETTYGWC